MHIDWTLGGHAAGRQRSPGQCGNDGNAVHHGSQKKKTINQATCNELIDIICAYDFSHYDLDTKTLIVLLCRTLRLKSYSSNLDQVLQQMEQQAIKATTDLAVDEHKLRHWILVQLLSRNQRLSRSAVVNLSGEDELLASVNQLWASSNATPETPQKPKAPFDAFKSPVADAPSNGEVWMSPPNIRPGSVQDELNQELQRVQYERLPLGRLSVHYIGCSGKLRPLRGLSHDLSHLHLLNVDRSFSHRLTGGSFAPTLSREDTLQELRAFFEQPDVQY